MSDQVVYVYGIISASLEASGAPGGIDDAPVCAERVGELAALLSRVDAATYAGGVAEARAGDLAWIGPRAIAHDAVLTWASDAGGVIPLPMFTLFSDLESARAMLRDRLVELTAILHRVAPAQEYTLRIFRHGNVPDDMLSELSPNVAELRRQAATATPGQRYLLERKLEAERRSALRSIGIAAAAAAFDALKPLCTGAVRHQIPAARGEDGGAVGAVLNASFLVRRDGADDFRSALTELARRHEPAGLRFEFTGPWPAYHFVSDGA